MYGFATDFQYPKSLRNIKVFAYCTIHGICHYITVTMAVSPRCTNSWSSIFKSHHIRLEEPFSSLVLLRHVWVLVQWLVLLFSPTGRRRETTKNQLFFPPWSSSLLVVTTDIHVLSGEYLCVDCFMVLVQVGNDLSKRSAENEWSTSSFTSGSQISMKKLVIHSLWSITGNTAILQSYVSQMTTSRERARYVSIMNMVGNLGYVFGPGIMWWYSWPS